MTTPSDKTLHHYEVEDTLARLVRAYQGLAGRLEHSGASGNMDAEAKARCDRLGTIEQARKRLAECEG